MGIQSALFSGISGLNANSQAMSVIGNNLANTNTIGFKGARTLFSDMLSSNVNGFGGTSQVGHGVGLSTIDNIFKQGTFESTNSDTDVAIDGEGFFIVKEPTGGANFYTRAGAFSFDENGFLVNPEGFRVQGQLFDPVTGVLAPGAPGDIVVEETGLVPARATDEIALNTNTDASSQVLAPIALTDPLLSYHPITNPIDPATYNYSTSTTVFDSLGENHLVNLYFRKENVITGTPATSPWNVYWTAENTGGDPLNLNPLTTPLTGLSFSENGLILDANGVDSNNPAFIPVDITIPNLNFANGSELVNLNVEFNMTQFDSVSRVISQEQNGYGAGSLSGVAIDGTGTVIATYSNGTQVSVATLALGKFQNPGGLKLAGSNLFEATRESGELRIGIPGPELGSIYTNSLEQSNVDMGQEFVKMITTQRGFQANSKIITTIDELLGELINLKR
jgi:flagellar hook protein FlgE